MNNLTSKHIEDKIEKIVKGLNKSANIIISTMGGYGKNVILSSTDNLVFTKDGVSVADYLKLTDPIENVGSRLLIEAANKTVEQCGDGTTLTTLFSKELINTLIKNIEDKNDINKLLNDIDDFILKFEEELIKSSSKIETFNDIYKIAKTSCKSALIGGLIKDIYEKTGFNASISVEMSSTTNSTYYQIINGLEFDSGMINSRFANQDNESCILDNATIILDNGVVNSPNEYMDVFNSAKESDTSVVIIAPNFSDSFVRFALTNKAQVGLKICLINAPGYGKGVEENFKDIIAFCNNNNQVDKIVVTPYSFTLYNNTDDYRINKRVSQLKKLAESSVEEYHEKDYLNRIVKLQQSGAIIYVGGYSKQQAKEEFDRIEDAIGAVKSALSMGYVRGAGCELYNIATILKDHESGCADVLKKPLMQILKNANINKSNLKFDLPYNVILKNYDESIIDPTSVLLNSFKNSCSLIKLLINTSYVVYND